MKNSKKLTECQSLFLQDGRKMTFYYTANIYSQTTAPLQPNSCISDWITAIDCAQWVAVIQYSKITMKMQSLTAMIIFHIFFGNSHVFGCNLAVQRKCWYDMQLWIVMGKNIWYQKGFLTRLKHVLICIVYFHNSKKEYQKDR